MRADGSRPNEGRPRIFKSPKEMLDAFLKYRTYEKANPILVHDYVGKDGVEVFRKKEVPLTMEGFKSWMFEQSGYNAGDLENYWNGTYAEFSEVSARIKEIIRTDQIRGGMAGIYNPSLTARINGLVDKVEKTVIQEQPLFSDESK
jgi:hypothetical protein